MFGKVFGGPLVHLVEYDEGQVVFRTKKALAEGQPVSLRVAGSHGKPARIQGVMGSCRPIASGGFACTAAVEDHAQRRELARLSAYTEVPGEGLRKQPRRPRRIEIDCPELKGVSVDVSAGGIQVMSETPLICEQSIRLTLSPGLTCKARVAWVSGDRAGLEFYQEDAVTEMLLERFASGRAVPTGGEKGPGGNSLLPPPEYA